MRVSLAQTSHDLQTLKEWVQRNIPQGDWRFHYAIDALNMGQSGLSLLEELGFSVEEGSNPPRRTSRL